MARIAIDLHGGDFGPSVLIPSSFQFFRNNPQHHGVLIGDSRVCHAFAHECPPNIEWIDADDVGAVAEKPSLLLRKDGHSSIEVAFKALFNHDVDVLVSSEHTGVLLALITKYGKLHSLLNRPVLASFLPTLSKPTVMLDLGASFSATYDQLLTYAAIGIGVANSDRPSLALLNVGTEKFKGPPELRAAHEKLTQWQQVDYRGFVEATEVFKGNVDVIVTDGFTGNSVIKSSEGALDLAFSIVKNRLSRGIVSRVLALWLRQEIKQSLKPLDPRLANGAIVAGSDLLVIKSHGNAKEKSFQAALARAASAHSQQLTRSIWKELDNLYDGDTWLS